MQHDLYAQNKKALHYFETMVPQVQETCKALSYLGITHFWYDQFLPSGAYFCLGNDLTWKRHFYAQDLFNHPNSLIHALKMTPCQQEQSFLWEDDPKARGCLIVSEQRKFNIGHTVSIISKKKDVAETFTFASSVDNMEMEAFYMRHIDVIKNFCGFFKEKAAPLIQICDMKDMASLNDNIFFPYEEEPHTWEKQINAFLQDIAVSPLIFPQYSKREKECLELLSTGMTAKAIARELGLSHRTVEYYMGNIRKKTGCQRETDLVRAFMQHQKS